jgi:transposase-like protein
VLLPEICLARRHDVVEVIGAALTASAMGSDHRQIAAEHGLPASTVRGWVRRARERAQDIRAHFTGWTAALDQAAVAELRPAGNELADAVEAIGAAGRAAVVELGVQRSPWSLASVLTTGALLSNTTSPWMAVP